MLFAVSIATYTTTKIRANFILWGAVLVLVGLIVEMTKVNEFFQGNLARVDDCYVTNVVCHV